MQFFRIFVKTLFLERLSIESRKYLIMWSLNLIFGFVMKSVWVCFRILDWQCLFCSMFHFQHLLVLRNYGHSKERDNHKMTIINNKISKYKKLLTYFLKSPCSLEFHVKYFKFRIQEYIFMESHFCGSLFQNWND